MTRHLIFTVYFSILASAFLSQNVLTDSLKKIALKVDKDSAAKLYIKIANVFTGVNSDSVRAYARIANGLASEGSTMKGDVLIQFGNSYHMEDNMDSALSYFKKGFEYFQKIGNDKGIGKAYQSFSLVKRSLGDLQGAIDDNKKALEIYKKIKWNLGVVLIYSNISGTYSKMSNTNQAVLYARLAFSGSKLLNDSLRYFSTMADYGSRLAFTRKVDSALYYIQESSRFLEKYNMYNLLIPAYGNLAAALDLNKESNIEIAKTALYKSIYYSRLSNALDNMRYIYRDFALLYLKEKKLDSAEFYFLKTITLIDSLNADEGIRLSKEIETKYETEKRELQLQKQSVEIEAKSNLLVIGSIALICIAFLAAFAFRNYVKVKKSNILINEQKKEVELKNDEIIRQKTIVDEKQKEILDSIQYARRIQQAMLPPVEFVNKYIPENFILYKPKDIVAGDFYWAEKVGDLFFIAAADSTGHGVPGAMVSVVCSNALNRSVKEFHITQPGAILDKTRELVLETFAKSGEDVKDGMDVSLLAFDFREKKIWWSGANNPLWYFQNNVFNEIKGDKQPVGKSDHSKPFTTHVINYSENTVLYLFTDGFPDQFGGSDGKKFKYKRFSELLASNSQLRLNQQHDLFYTTFMNWKRDIEQTDDVCLIGIRI